MQELMTVALTAMQRDGARVERVANNIANQLTPGYKREFLVERSGESSFSKMLAPAAAAGQVSVLTDTKSGSLRKTGQSLDLAIAGPGFLEVSTPQGPAYTRRGQMRLDERGTLVTASGLPVMGQSGELTLTSSQVSIAADGTVKNGDQIVGQLQLYEADAQTRLSSIGDGLYAAEGSMSIKTAAEVHLKQGYLENSNVDSAHEMVELMGAVRHFEAMHHAAQGYDDMMATALRKLGDL
ncbi:MAG TPA: flagellar hook basal-body protein [Burkholderiaceae bacterium]|jgi:flagellar basal-body rod protein FlgG